jgi:hypothetical protein
MPVVTGGAVLIHGCPGFASVIGVGLSLGGIQLLPLGSIGQYLARVYREVTQGVLYPVRARNGFDGGAEVAGGREI